MRAPNLTLQAAGFFALAFVIFLAMGIIMLTVAAKSARTNPGFARGERKLASWFILWAVLGIAWVFFAFERINLFGAPFWLPLGVLGALLWLAFIVKYYLRTLPALRAAEHARAEREKYLPKKK